MSLQWALQAKQLARMVPSAETTAQWPPPPAASKATHVCIGQEGCICLHTAFVCSAASDAAIPSPRINLSIHNALNTANPVADA